MQDQSDNRKIAIQIKGVKKQYRLGQIGGGTLQGDLQSWWARVRGKEDPNLKIGQEERLVGQTFMALNGIDMTIYQGEAVGIIGSNGAGKSTLLKLLSRVTAPTAGEIDIYGRIASMLEVGTGFNQEMTGRENVYMNGAILGMTKAEIDAKMEDIIEFSEVRDFIDTPVKRYSSGMYVKLAFSVAAHLDSEIMIMDEVLAVGDVKFQQKCLNKMRDASKQEGRTVLYVSHNMNTIRQLCDRCFVLDKGKVVFEGAVERAIEIYSGSTDRSSNVIDMKKIPRSPEFSNLPVTMTRFTVNNNDSSVYTVGDKIEGDLEFTSPKEFPETFLRIIIKSVDGTPITMINAGKSFPVYKDTLQSISFSIDISRIVPGKYMLGFVLYEVNEYGGNLNLDVLKDIYYFDIDTVNGFNHNMAWEPRYWGYFYGEEIEQIDMRENKEQQQ